MKKLNTIGALFVVSVSLLNGCGTLKEEALTSASTNAEVKQEDGNIQVQEYEVRIQGNKETLKVEMPMNEYDVPSYWSFLIGEDEKLKVTNDAGFIHTEIKLQDLDQDDTEEILFYRYSTGTGADILLNIYKPSGDEFVVLLESEKLIQMHGDNHRFEIKYAGDYQVSFLDKEKDVSTTIKLNPEEYKKGADELLPGISTWIDPVSMIDIKDLDGDGTAELMTTQRVIGVGHPDTIALLLSTFSLNHQGFELRNYKLVYEEDPSKVIVQWQ
jgi:hypothetical protein